MKPETRKEVNRLLKTAAGTPKRNDLGTVAVKDLLDAKRTGREQQAKIAITNYKSWKRS